MNLKRKTIEFGGTTKLPLQAFNLPLLAFENGGYFAGEMHTLRASLLLMALGTAVIYDH
jgi:hypothetical protein